MYNPGLLKKLLLSYGAMTIPLAVLASLALTSGKFAESSMERIYLRQILPAAELEEINLHARDMSVRMTGYLAGQLPATGARNKITENKKDIDDHWTRYLGQINRDEMTPEQRQLIDDMNVAIGSDVPAFIKKCEQALTADNKDQALEILENDWPLIQMKLIKPIAKLSEIQQFSIQAVYENAKSKSQNILKFVIIAIFASVAVLASSLWMMSKMTNSILISITDVDNLGGVVRSESHECSTKTNNLSEGITGVASSLEQTASAVEELTSIVKTNSQYAREASDIAAENTRNAEEGEKKIKGMLQSMSNMAECSKKIENAISVIDDISFQINLLALNAAVEAARAGAAGKGFAVVAEAVRTLADKSALSAKEINALIKENVELASSGKNTAIESGEVLQNIVTAIKNVSEINSKIAYASEEQLTGLMQISTAVGQIDTLSQANASISESLVLSSHQLADEGRNLQGLVTRLLGVVKGGNTRSAF